MTVYNIYCDENCHMENDHQQVMILGAVWCPLEKSQELSKRLREIKGRHGIRSEFETKWTKVSPAKKDFYIDLIDYFFDNEHLHFRALIIPDKSMLQHEKFGQDHDTWYYKMYFDMLKVILSPDDCYRIYLDIKDTRGASKVKNCMTFYVTACMISSAGLLNGFRLSDRMKWKCSSLLIY